MRIAVGSDEDAPLLAAVVRHLEEGGHAVDVVSRSAPWPEAGRSVAERVVSGTADLGVVCCWTGTGVSMAANKVRGVRAALCADAATAEGARRWNDANVLALSIRITTAAVAAEILDAFLRSTPDAGELATISKLE